MELVASLIASLSHRGMDYMAFQWFLALCFLSFGVTLHIYFRSDILPAAVFLYSALSAIYCFGLVGNIYDAWPVRSEIAYESMRAFCYLLCVVACVFLANHWSLNALFLSVPLIILANSIYVLFGYINGTGRFNQGVGYSGFIDYAGMNGSLIAACTPLIFKENYKLWFVCLASICAFLSIFVSKSCVPYGVLFVALGTFHGHRIRDVAQFSAFSVLVTIGVLLRNRFYPWLDDAHRFEAYRVFMVAWFRNANRWFGTGLGTFGVFSRDIQQTTGFMVQPDGTMYWWPWLHSDWLESIFETGFIGSALTVALFFDVARRLYNRVELGAHFGLWCGIGAAAVFDYPLRYPSFSILIAALIAVAYSKDGKPCPRTF